MIQENWKDIPNYEGLYQASDLGNIKRNNKLLKPSINHYGYYYVVLCKEGKSKTFRIHRLVLLAFKGNSDLIVDHINGNKLDNKLSNIEYVTPRENSKRYHIQQNTTSKYIGVSKQKSGRWRSMVHINGTSRHIGTFFTEFEAHIAYQEYINK